MDSGIDILFTQELIEPIGQRHKTHTIRLGWRNFKPGRAVAGCPVANWRQDIIIRTVTLTLAKYVYARAYGYDGPEHFIESMRKYYPDFNDNSPVTIIAFVLA